MESSQAQVLEQGFPLAGSKTVLRKSPSTDDSNPNMTEDGQKCKDPSSMFIPGTPKITLPFFTLFVRSELQRFSANKKSSCS